MTVPLIISFFVFFVYIVILALVVFSNLTRQYTILFYIFFYFRFNLINILFYIVLGNLPSSWSCPHTEKM